ncbi:hypothetical protein BCR35DRAFT_306371 [Leucosporidium creatinivorum]|uniref:Uncharacterized protein n=1 Tax=Leucosporidium creatinivorum TaxID=106004 RepID=A0A1Y2EV48_9BASI|nr:hypothetical protein BCR35DRAFT_306371 [Leucosporidium creatinivorum]
MSRFAVNSPRPCWARLRAVLTFAASDSATGVLWRRSGCRSRHRCNGLAKIPSFPSIIAEATPWLASFHQSSSPHL